MRVLILAAYYCPDIGGYPKNVHELAKRLVETGHEVTVATCSHGGPIKDGVEIVRLPSWITLRGEYPIPKPSKALSGLWKARYDVVITQTRFFLTSLWGAVYAKCNHVPLIHVERGSDHCVVSNPVVRALARMYDHTAGHWIVSQAQHNIGVSRMACSFVEHIGGRDPEVVHNGISTSRLRVTRDDDICFVGRLVYGKGVQDLISAFEQCCASKAANTANIRLVIVGDGNYRRCLESQAKASPYSDRIVFMGQLSNQDALKVMARCRIFVNPSYTEGLPTAVLEAASLGKAVVAADVGGTGEIITPGISGWLYPPHDVKQLTATLLRLLRHPGTAREYGEVAQEAVHKSFSWKKIAARYNEIINIISPV